MSADWSDGFRDRAGYPTPLRVVTDTEAAAARGAHAALVLEALRMADKFADYKRRGWESMKTPSGDRLIAAAADLRAAVNGEIT